jgi:DNA-binding LacI/PurR family transcriptional regulator
MQRVFEVTTPLPARGSASALRQQLVEHLLRNRPNVGDRFLSDHELARITRLSRPTVRRALDELQRDGWIERRPGIGTFIGPRAGLPQHEHRRHNHNGSSRQTVRLALLMHMLGDFAQDFYVAGLISGIDSVAEETGVSIELVGNRDGDVSSASRRLLQSRPDVLALAAPPLKHTVLIGEARRLEIPVIGTGTLMANVGAPAVCEDGEDGARQAVRHLVERGHRRIGFIVPTFPLPWVFQRRRGYIAGMTEAGLDAEEEMTLWIENHNEPAGADAVREFLRRRRPTAVVLASWVLASDLAPLVQSGELVIPRDLSVVTFDQQPGVAAKLGNVTPTTISIPLHQMGVRLAHMARNLIDGETVDTVTTLPCSLVEGESVASIEPA